MTDRTSDDRAERFLAVGAHPDDLESGAGGLMSMLVDNGWQGTYLLCTDGSKGARDAREAEDLAARRSAEQRQAAERIGISRVISLSYQDGELVSDLTLRADIVRAIRDVRPAVVITWDPSSYWIGDGGMNHPDHMACGEATCFAVYPAARNAMTFPELQEQGLGVHEVDELWLFGTNRPNAFLDISARRNQKDAALLAHASQVYTMGGQARARRRARWVVREYDNPITRRLQDRPECLEKFRRIVIEREVVHLNPELFHDDAAED